MNALLARCLAVLIVALPGVAFAQRAPVPVVLPHPPPVTNPTSSQIFDAMLAISRAQQSNPRAAQDASVAYAKAVQQYRSGDAAGARRSAAQAALTAGAPIQPAPTIALPPLSTILPPAAPQIPGTQGGLYGADAPAIDADSFLALARGLLADCGARHDPAVPAAQRHYDVAARAFAAHNWQTARMEAKAAIDACAKPAISGR